MHLSQMVTSLAIVKERSHSMCIVVDALKAAYAAPITVIVVLLLMCGAILPIHAQDAATATPDVLAIAPRGTITGKVSNGTAASTVPTSLNITLLINNNDVTVQRMETQSSADGSFQFTDVPMITGYDYVTAASYRDRIFNSIFQVGNAAKTSLDLPITIYELTEDPSVLSISRSEAQLNALAGALEVRQVIHFKNSSDRLYTTSKDLGNGRFGSVLISLPPGAQVVSLNNEPRYIVSVKDFTVLDTNPVLPGDSHVVVVAYIIPFDGSAAIIEQPMNYPFEGQAKLLLVQNTLKIKSQQLATAGSQPIAEIVYQSYSGTLKLKAGEVIQYEVSGTVSSSNTISSTSSAKPAGSNSAILLVLTALIVIGIIAAIAALVLQQRQQRPPRPEQLIEALTQQIALLDQKHAAGQLPHDLWHQQRRPLQARLEELQGD